VKVLGLVLVGAGVLALVFGGIDYNQKKTILDVGPLKATATEQHHLPIPPIAGGLALVVGLVLILKPGGKPAA